MLNYKEETIDLFSVDNSYFLVQCISADFAMGKGIAIKFNQHYNVKHNLYSILQGNYIACWDNNDTKGTCLQVNCVLNLVTKRNYWQKPTYKTMTNALYSMKQIIQEQHIKKIAMPTIGCGLDKLEWINVKEIIQHVFADTDIEILVCRQ